MSSSSLSLYEVINFRTEMKKTDLIEQVSKFITDHPDGGEEMLALFNKAHQNGVLLRVQYSWNESGQFYKANRNTLLVVPRALGEFLTNNTPKFSERTYESFHVSQYQTRDNLRFKKTFTIEKDDKTLTFEQNPKNVNLSMNYYEDSRQERSPYLAEIADYFWKTLVPSFRRAYGFGEKDISSSGSTRDMIKIVFSDRIPLETREMIVFTLSTCYETFGNLEHRIPLFNRIRWGRVYKQRE